MKNTVIIRDIFNISNGLTVLACDRPKTHHVWRQKTAIIQSEKGDFRQKITIYDERKMIGDNVNNSIIAIETRDIVDLSNEDAKSGFWTLSLD